MSITDWTSHIDEYAITLERADKKAKEAGLVLNPDIARLEKVIGLMTNNKVKFGAYYCPCKQSHPLDTSKDTLCPCDAWLDEVAKDGRCFCKLFFKP